MSERDWAKDELSLEYLLDSGLLFKANQTIFHLFGFALSIRTNRETGEQTIGFVDNRATPENMTFPESVFERGEEKYAAFRDEFGGRQMNRRRNKLGIGCQNYAKVPSKQ